MIITAADFRAARDRLGMSRRQLTQALRLAESTGGKTIARWEDGEVPVSGPVCVAMEYMLREHARIEHGEHV